ncbi:gamma-glutamyltransferase [Legionella sp. CNM-4043-24]|uniref:gamma-glutamyltransferase n=1 Tax=Legionella sp. CNM-4043-24 TaxID=3421646 RepID=UPI00403A9233
MKAVLHLLAGVSLFTLFSASAHALPLHEKPPGYAVASAHPLATSAGLEILAAGGNAFDAAVAVSAALAVVEPYHSGLGGGGFWLLHDGKSKKNILIDGREVAPMAASKDMFLDKQGNVIPGLSLNGGLAAAIPGEPAALVYISEHYGRLPLARVLAPAIKLAEDGFDMDTRFYDFARNEDRLEQLLRFPDTAAVFLNKGEPWRPGKRFRQPDLANTLKQLAQHGQDGFYRGDVAEKLVKGVRAAGGIWTLNDLSRYQIKLREPLIGAYRNMLIITAPPPSSGGYILLTTLALLDNVELESLPEVQRLSRLIEAMRVTYWQASQTMGDPDFIPLAIDKLLSSDNLSYLRSLIPQGQVTPSSRFEGSAPHDNQPNTTQIAIIDSEDNRVSATMTVNYIFGSSVVPAGTGVIVNDEMDDFSAKAGARNVFGLVGNDKNAIAPGKRPVSSMAPSFLEMPGRVAVYGTPGGSRIPSMLLLAALEFSRYHGAISMVSAMRFHHQYLPDWVQFEPETFSPDIQAGLKALGYQLMALKQYYGDMQAITWDKSLNIVTAASDPRHMGSALMVSSAPARYGFRH